MCQAIRTEIFIVIIYDKIGCVPKLNTTAYFAIYFLMRGR